MKISLSGALIVLAFSSQAAFAATIPAKPADGAAAATAERVVRIGYQKYGSLIILKTSGVLDKALAEKGWKVDWKLFVAGPALLEALNAGSLDFGTTGEAPPIFAQAANAPLLYVANEPPSPEGEAILVPKDSPLKSVAELKGKKIALNKGSNVHYLLVKALEKAGVDYKDVQTVFLPPPDARAAFERGSVDAWVIWDPFYGAAQAQLGARKLQDGTGLVNNVQFYFSTKSFAAANPALVQDIIASVGTADKWAREKPHDAAVQLSPEVGLSVEILDPLVKRLGLEVQPINDRTIADQQKIADAFVALGLIPKAISVKDAQWVPPLEATAAKAKAKTK
jgi:sulfonate transport system substrate-binding protein